MALLRPERLRYVAPVIAALEAYTVGRRVGEEWARGALDLHEFRDLWRHQGALTWAAALTTTGLAAWNIARHPRMLAAAIVGGIVGARMLTRRAPSARSAP